MELIEIELEEVISASPGKDDDFEDLGPGNGNENPGYLNINTSVKTKIKA